MLFRNLTLYRLQPEFAEALENRTTSSIYLDIRREQIKPLGPQSLSTAGFVGPNPEHPIDLVQSSTDYLLLTMAKLERLLPAAVVNTEVAREVATLEAAYGRRVGGRERKRIRDDVLFGMIPQAFVRERRVSGYIDTKRGWIVIDTATRSTAEAFMTLLRLALETVPARPTDPEESPRAIMTAWVSNGFRDTPAEQRLELGDSICMKHYADGGATVRCKHENLEGDEVLEHIRSGKHVQRLGLLWGAQLSFELGDDLVVRKLRVLDTHAEQEDDSEPLFAAQLQVMGDQIGRLLEDLDAIFKLPYHTR